MVAAQVMVDVKGRRRAAALVAQIRDGLITNDQFEDAYPMHSNDRALFAVFMDVWSLYDDLHEHRLETLPDEIVQRLRRCELFLKTDLPYEWPRWFLSFGTFLLLPVNIVTFGLLGRLLRLKFERAGDATVWPFIRRADYEQLLQTAASPTAK
jgi:hypothetical protein